MHTLTKKLHSTTSPYATYGSITSFVILSKLHYCMQILGLWINLFLLKLVYSKKALRLGITALLKFQFFVQILGLWGRDFVTKLQGLKNFYLNLIATHAFKLGVSYGG